jgi:ABC-type branched-subunit amino acid transport system ATPase component
MARPKLILMDEPSMGLSPLLVKEVFAIIRRLNEELGITILLVEHDMSFVMGICEYIYVLDFGRVIASGTPSEVQANPTVQAAYLGTDSVEEAS